ncbi:hypothetical protein D1AOALGA4SA_4851 [Olavius algarvensis Delta 1 endosymbiont]|nr:hypothetical protein D1AOALGA4SA_4851 [Olavius algarvensis Delta 1 endosymbiont]
MDVAALRHFYVRLPGFLKNIPLDLQTLPLFVKELLVD